MALFVLATLVLFALAGEAYVRLTFDPPLPTPAELRARSLRYRPAVFARHVLAAEATQVQGWMGGVWRINALGYRGPDFAIEKPAGTLRVMVYGGSAVFDSGNTSGHDWPHRLQALLHKRGLERVEVVNAGIPGHASFDAVGRLFAEGHRFQPDYVVLYAAWNDIKSYTWTKPLLRELRPYREKRDPRIHTTGSLDAFFCELSQLYLLLRGWYQAEKYDLGPEGARPADELQDDLEPAALRQHRLGVETFVDVARSAGAEPILVLQARLVQPGNTPDQKRRIKQEYVRLTHQALCRAFDAADTIMREVASAKGVHLVESTSGMNGNDDFFLDHVHLNSAGSATLAGILADELAPLFTPGEPPRKPEEPTADPVGQ